MVFNKKYFLLSILLFFTEAYIAAYVNDAFVRPFMGDTLAVILLYCLVKAFFSLSVSKATMGALLVAYAIEISQYFHLARLLGLAHSKTAALLIGSSFSYIDLLMYTAGAVIILLAERFFQNTNTYETTAKQ